MTFLIFGLFFAGYVLIYAGVTNTSVSSLVLSGLGFHTPRNNV